MGRTFMAATTDIAAAGEGLGEHGFFTYALLQAFARADENDNGLIEIGEAARYVSAELPKLSLKASFKRQMPQIKIIGADFPLLTRIDIADIDELLGAGTTPR